MDHADHVDLLRAGVPPGGRWADLGAGTGAFTLALADLLGAGGVIHAIDRDRAALAVAERAVRSRFPGVELLATPGDFTRPLPLASLDGVVMANSLHFVREKLPVLALVRAYLRPGGRFVLVGYDVDRGNPWVPWPVSLAAWMRLAAEAGFVGTRPIGRVSSRFLGAIYSARSVAPDGPPGPGLPAGTLMLDSAPRGDDREE